MELTTEKQERLLEDVATLKQSAIEATRRLESYHTAITNYELIRREEKIEMKDWVKAENKLLSHEIKEHINHALGLARKDTEDKINQVSTIANDALGQINFVKKAGYIIMIFLGWISDIAGKIKNLI